MDIGDSILHNGTSKSVSSPWFIYRTIMKKNEVYMSKLTKRKKIEVTLEILHILSSNFNTGMIQYRPRGVSPPLVV